ncbi:MAG: hypothetical protein SCM96_05070 [Acidobacteriota bacterium]|nr:hypothetical protein [Acidobacteriota bacterium]
MTASREVTVVLAVLSMASFIYHVLKWISRKQKIGVVICIWSARLDPRIPGNRVYLVFLFLMIVVSIYFAVFPADEVADYRMLAFLLLILSFAPRWNAAVGSSAMILRSKIIRNEEVIDRKIDIRGKTKILTVQWSTPGNNSVVKEISVPVPFRTLSF